MVKSVVIAVALISAARFTGAQSGTAYGRALQFEAADNYRDAAVAYREALRAEPGNLPAMLGLERSYAQLGWTDSLLTLLDSALTARPTDATLRTIQLRTLRSTRDDAALRAAFEHWLRAAPRQQAPYREYAKILLQDGFSGAADSVLTRAEAALGSGEGLELEAAQIRASMGLWRQSAEAWRKAVAGAAYLEQAAIFSLAPAPAAAREEVRKSLLAAPLVVGARRIGAALELDWGFPRAGWDLLRALPPDSAVVRAWVDFARRAEEAQAWLVARDALMAAYARTGSAALAARAASDAMNGGDMRAALSISAALSADTGAASLAVLPVRLRALASLGRADEAAQALEAAKGRIPAEQYARLSRSVAWGWIRRGDLAKARAHLKASDDEERDDPVYGWLALYEGDLRGARRMLATQSESAPDLVAALALLARTKADSAPTVGRAFLALARADTARAVSEFQESAHALPEAGTLLLAAAARLAGASQQDSRALAIWRVLAERHPDSPEAPEAELEWARILGRSGQNSAAVLRLEHLILAFPGSALVPQARRELEIARANIPSTR
ncbi:MAG: hypothetical protein H0W30_09725 [Gemmatimonadaceae bacterium]|nr:hypothetical protein [Gemmatimonadaceae bacterium]